jgi:hypothetical protein
MSAFGDSVAGKQEHFGMGSKKVCLHLLKTLLVSALS